jgi:hypothetical protein
MTEGYKKNLICQEYILETPFDCFEIWLLACKQQGYRIRTKDSSRVEEYGK